MTRGTAVFCISAGAAIPVLWLTLLATSQVTDLNERAVAYAFHWTAEGLTSVLLLVSGAAILIGMARARRLFFLAIGLLGIAALGMCVYYALRGDVPFAAMGLMISALTIFFVLKNGMSIRDAVYAICGVTLYVFLTAGGNALHSGDMLSAVYLLLACVVVAGFTVARLRGAPE